MIRAGVIALVVAALTAGARAQAETETGTEAETETGTETATETATETETATGTETETPKQKAPAAKKKPAAKKATAKKTGKLTKTEDKVEGGLHWRIESEKGAVHVWVPPGYDRATAGTVVYVHGYHTDADGAWKDHDLAAQFKKSRQNAMFIVPDAPSGKDEQVHWPALADLRKAVSRGNIRLPDGPTVVMGHSGAYRTVMQWVDHKLVQQVILLDAMYGGESKFDEFISTGKRAHNHKLIVVGSDTATESKDFIKKYPFAVVRDGMPDTVAGFTKKEKRAKLLYIKSQYRHMPIVTNGKVIPLLLRITPLKAL